MGTNSIRDYRMINKLTLAVASAKIGCSPGNLSRIERGLQTVTTTLAVKLAALYGVTVDEILSAIPQR